MDIREEMIKYRARENISMREMAERCKVSMQTIYSIENGLQEPGRLTREKIRLVIGKEEAE